PWLWEAMQSRRGTWCNRLRAPDWRRLFERYFELVAFEELRPDPFPKDFDRSKLATPFQKYDDQALSISQLWIIARKPARGAGLRVSPVPEAEPFAACWQGSASEEILQDIEPTGAIIRPGAPAPG